MKQKKKIIVFARHFYPKIGGLENEILEIFSRLVERGWDITVHTCVDGTNRAKRKDLVNGIRVFRYSNKEYSLLPIHKLIENDGEFVSLHNIEDLPHFSIYLYALVLKLIGKKNFKLIFSSHGFFNVNPSIYPGYKVKIKTFIDHRIGVWLINRTVDSIRAVSKREMIGLLKYGVKSDLIKVIYSGLDDDVFKQNLKLTPQTKALVRSNYFLQVGRVVRVKNYEAVINAMKYVKNPAKFVIAGPFDDKIYKSELDNLIKKNSLQDRIIFLGPIYGDEKIALMRNAKFYTQLSWSEGYPLSLLEAKSQGIVCLISEGTGMSEMVSDKVNGFVVDARNTKQVANRINYLLDENNTEEIAKMKKNNLLETKTATLSNTTSQIENLYLETAKKILL